jgi:DNA replication licensing factor MCM6
LKCFFHFWFVWSSFRLDGQNRNIGEPYYDAEIEAMKANESTTMFIDFSHVMLFNDVLQKAIADEYFRYTKRNDFELKSV